MGNNKISIYKDNPTAGGTDGTEVSSNTKSAPISFTLKSTHNETKFMKCAIRCAPGYQTVGTITISFEGLTRPHWSICTDNNYTDDTVETSGASFTNSLQITDTITDKNTIFWLRADSTDVELLGRDASVNVNVKGSTIRTSDYQAFIED